MIAAALALYWVFLPRVVLAQLLPEDAPPKSNTTIPNKCGAECVRCAVDGCVKCARVLVWPGRVCAATCPPGSRDSWSQDHHLMGRVCYPHQYYSEALVGAACGVAFCLLLAACGAVYARVRSKPRAVPLPQRPKHDDDNQLREFHKQLDCLRPHAYTLLSILNNTRRQVRELYMLGNNEAAMAYSCVLSDLAKLLILLNKRHVPVVPEEWPRLASWAERVLSRYSRVTMGSQQQVNQLVNFLQPSSQDSDDQSSQAFSTFRPPSYSPRSYDDNILDKELESQCDWSDGGRPPSYSFIERENIPMTLHHPWEMRPMARRESVWLEDENLKLERPQDELTTEL